MSNLLARILTRSFPGKAETPIGLALQTDEPAEPADSPASYESRAFALWNESLPDSTGRILDLGRLHSHTLQFFQQQGAQLTVQALDTSLSGTAFEMQLQSHEQEAFRGVLAWDLCNYLDAGELAALGQWLSRHCEPGCPVLICLASRAPYANQPGQYAIEDASHLRTIASDSIPDERRLLHTSSALLRAFEQFESVRSFLLRSGMQEYVLRHV